MKAVMEGGFRPVVLQEVFRRFPEFIDAEKASGLRLSVGFRVGGRKDGEVDRYVVHVADGACTIETGAPEGQSRDATITMEGADFLRLALGQLHPVRGVLTGALKVKGDRAKALALNAVMVPPQPRQD
jgi:putative sterol carrier protein